MSERYTTHNVFLKSADFHILIIEYPSTDINDKLALLAPEKGLIYRHLYEDFVMGACLANSGAFFYHIRRRAELIPKIELIRQEVLTNIYEHCPALSPENIVINDNNLLKTRDSVRPGENVRPLVDNDLWDQDPPLSSFGPAVITSSPNRDNPFDDDEYQEPDMDAPEIPINPENPFDENSGGGSGDVPYELIGHHWKKIGLHINVRQYEDSEESVAALLGGSSFDTKNGYHLLVVQLCIEDFADIFHLLDKQGISRMTPPHEIMAELYEISILYNPFLKFEDVDLSQIRRQHRNKQRSRMRNNRRIAAAGVADEAVRGRRKKKFSDLPKEKLLGLAEEMKKQVIGQDEAVEMISDAVLRASVGLKREHEPLGVFLLTGQTGVGKCLAPGTEILMFDGSIKKVEDVVVGDRLMGPDSLPRTVLSTCSGTDQMYQIQPKKGSAWTCNSPHVLTLVHTETGEIIDIPLNEYLTKNKRFKHLYKLFRAPVEFELQAPLPLDPYFVGLWLGDGEKKLSAAIVSNVDEEIISYLHEVAELHGLGLVNYEKREGFCPRWAFTAGNIGGKPNPFLNKLRQAITEEFSVVPEYKTASEKDRLQFLAGIIDADGALEHNCFDIVLKHTTLAKDVTFIARSVGFRVTESMKFVDGNWYNRVCISGDTHRIPVRVSRKKPTVRKQIKNVLRTGFDVEAVGEGLYYGFTLDADGRFLLGDFTVTHNTHTAKVLAECLGAGLVRIDCQEYQHAHEVAKLTGSPPGYVGYDDGGHLAKDVFKTPFSVVLFDEIEKAHGNFHERVLQIIDDGVLTDNKNRKISFRDTLIVMTSNIGVKEVDSLKKTVGFGDVASKTEKRTSKAREEALKKKFKPEFLNRIDEVVHFRTLEKDDFMHVLDILLDEVNEQINKSQKIALTFNIGAKNFLLDKGVDKKYGARPMRRVIKKYLNTPLAREILEDKITEGSKVTVSLKKEKDGLCFRTPKRKANGD